MAWTVAVLASTVAIAASAAVAALAPLKSVEPYVVRVNQTTGSVDVMTGLTGERGVTYNEAVSKSFLAQYVRAREGYLPPAAQENFQFVTILSTPDEQQRWADLYRATNPQSPQVLVGPDGSATVTIRNITFINDKVANVRFSKTVRLGQEVKVTDWIATLKQVCPSLSDEDAAEVHALGCKRAVVVSVASLRALILEWSASTT